MLGLTVSVGERDHIQGLETAPVTLLEYGNYECSRCRQFYCIIEQVQMHFGSQLCFVFRHFPLTTIYPMAQHAAETAEAAGAQGRFWEVHNYLFKHQRSLCDKMLLRYAATLELDVERFEREIAEHVYAPKVHEDLQSGIESGVNGTPTFFINGKRENGVQDFSALVNAITREVT